MPSLTAVKAWMLAGQQVILGMRHEAQNGTGGVGEAGDMMTGTIGVARITGVLPGRGSIAQGRQLQGLGARQPGLVGKNQLAFAMCDRAQNRLLQIPGKDARAGGIGFQGHPAALKTRRIVARQGRHQPSVIRPVEPW